MLSKSIAYANRRRIFRDFSRAKIRENPEIKPYAIAEEIWRSLAPKNSNLLRSESQKKSQKNGQFLCEFFCDENAEDDP